MIVVKIGDLVSVPDRMCYPGRRDPYEWENGKVIELGNNKKGESVCKVHVYRSFYKQHYEKWFRVSSVKKVSYSHRKGEEEEFLREMAAI